jgi:hypothetical protein
MLSWAWCLWENTPFCLGWWLERALLPLILGATVAAFAVWQLRRKRSFDYASEQLGKFYAPMLGKLSELKAHRNFDGTLKRLSGEAHSASLDQERPISSALVRESLAIGEQINRLFGEILPRRFSCQRVDLYVAMRQHFTENLAYADEDTCLEFYTDVYEQVETMLVYRDTPEDDLLPGVRATLGATIDMLRLDAFERHVHSKVQALKREIKG